MADSSGPACFAVPIPEHLIPTIVEAIEGELERACDDAWSDGSRTSVLKAARLWDGFTAKTLTLSQIAEVALQAVQWIEPLWPKTIEDVDRAERCWPRHAS
jgi:hypothetical protein